MLRSLTHELGCRPTPRDLPPSTRPPTHPRIHPRCASCATNQLTWQAELFNLSGIRKLVTDSMRGYKNTCFAYGQTGSGKTFTMSGVEEKLATSDYQLQHPTQGVITRALQHLFECVQAHPEAASFRIEASAIEIYNEHVYDLLYYTGKPLVRRVRYHGYHWVRVVVLSRAGVVLASCPRRPVCRALSWTHARSEYGWDFVADRGGRDGAVGWCVQYDSGVSLVPCARPPPPPSLARDAAGHPAVQVARFHSRELENVSLAGHGADVSGAALLACLPAALSPPTRVGPAASLPQP
jgi:hypothetical protein